MHNLRDGGKSTGCQCKELKIFGHIGASKHHRDKSGQVLLHIDPNPTIGKHYFTPQAAPWETTWEGVHLRGCTLERVYTWEGVHLRGCALERVYTWEGVHLRGCTLERVCTWDGVHLRGCTLKRVYTWERVHLRGCATWEHLSKRVFH